MNKFNGKKGDKPNISIYMYCNEPPHLLHNCKSTHKGLHCSLRCRHHCNGHRDQSDSTGLRSCRHSYKQSRQGSWYRWRCPYRHRTGVGNFIQCVLYVDTEERD